MAKKSFLHGILFLSILFVFTVISCSNAKIKNNEKSIAVFIPGIVSGSPVYEMLSNGVTTAVLDYNKTQEEGNLATVAVIEAGTNQAEWSGKMTAIVSSGKYGVIITSNPSMPDIVLPLTSKYPDIKFILLDASCSGNSNIASILYNQREQSYLSGYVSALVASASDSEMKYSNGQKKIALIAAQEYPVMNDILLPGFIEGAKAAVPDISVEFRVVGNWTDASKASEISRVLYQNGVRVILPIAGGGSQGVIAAAEELGFYIAWFDDNGFQKAPGYVISSAIIQQYKAAYESTLGYLSNKTLFGSSVTYGIHEGYVDFIRDEPLYKSTVNDKIRSEMDKVYESIKTGELLLDIK